MSNHGRPALPWDEQQTLTPLDIDTSPSSVYSLRGMEKPVPSFRSFVRAVAPLPKAYKPLPPLPQRRRRSSSVYIPRASRGLAIDLDSPTDPFYLQRNTVRFSNPELSVPKPEDKQILQPTVYSPKSSSKKSPDLYFTPLRSPRGKKRLQEKDIYLKPSTFSPASKQVRDDQARQREVHTRTRGSPVRSPATSPPNSASYATSKPSRSAAGTPSNLYRENVGRPTRRKSPVTPPGAKGKDAHIDALFEMTADALAKSVREEHIVPREKLNPEPSMQYRAHVHASLQKAASQNRERVALDVDNRSVRQEVELRRRQPDVEQEPPPVLKKTYQPRPMVLKADPAPSNDAIPPPPRTPSRSSSLLSEVLEAYATDFKEVSEAKLFNEDYHAVLNDQRAAEMIKKRRAPPNAETHLIPRPLFWKPSSHTNKSQSKSSAEAKKARRGSAKYRAQKPPTAPAPATPDVPRQYLFADLPPGSLPASFLKPHKEKRSLPEVAASIFHKNSDKQEVAVEPAGFDYSRPLERRPSGKAERMRAAVERAKAEKAHGYAGAVVIFNAIAMKGIPPEKEDPFGMNSVSAKRSLEPIIEPEKSEEVGNAKRSRPLHLGFGAFRNSMRKDAGDKRRQELKSSIRMVGQTDPHIMQDGDGYEIKTRDFALGSQRASASSDPRNRA